MKFYVVSNELKVVIAGSHVKTPFSAAIEALLTYASGDIKLANVVAVSCRGFELNNHNTDEDYFFDTEEVMRHAGFTFEE